jgi:hypothetical protein
MCNFSATIYSTGLQTGMALCTTYIFVKIQILTFQDIAFCQTGIDFSAETAASIFQIEVDAYINIFLTFMGPYIVNVFLSTTNEMQRYTIFFTVVSAVHVSSGLSAHNQELKNCTCSIGY